MPTQVEIESEQRSLVEHFRATGYEGREPWISGLDPLIGARIVAVRQLEACASQPACAWRDEVDDEIGLWGFMRDCLLTYLVSFARIIGETVAQQPIGAREAVQANEIFGVAWKTICRLLERLQSADPSKTSYSETAIGFLMAVMVLRQIVDREARGSAAGTAYFQPHSTNVHPTFLPCLFEKLGSTVIDLSRPPTLSELCFQLDGWSRPGLDPLEDQLRKAHAHQ